LLHLSIDKAYHQLGWSPKWNFDETVSKTIEWYKVSQRNPMAIRDFTLEQIQLYEANHTPAKQVEQEQAILS